MSISNISPLKRKASEPPATPPKRTKAAAVAEEGFSVLMKTPSPLKEKFALTPGREIRPGTPSTKHYPKALGTGKSKEHYKLCKDLRKRLMHTLASPNASPKSAKKRLGPTVVVESDGYFRSPSGTKYSAHRNADADGEQVIFPVSGPRTVRVSGHHAAIIVKKLRKTNERASVLKEIEAKLLKKNS